MVASDSPQTPSSLSEATIRDRTTVTRLIDGMVRKDLVIRRENSADRRRSDITPSPAGLALEKKLVPIALDLISEVSTGVTADDLEITRRTLTQLTHNLISLD